MFPAGNVSHSHLLGRSVRGPLLSPHLAHPPREGNDLFMVAEGRDWAQIFLGISVSAMQSAEEFCPGGQGCACLVWEDIRKSIWPESQLFSSQLYQITGGVSLVAPVVNTPAKAGGVDRSLMEEDPTCRRGTKPTRPQLLEPVLAGRALQGEKAPQGEAHTSTKSSPHSPQLEKSLRDNEDPAQPKIKKYRKEILLKGTVCL